MKKSLSLIVAVAVVIGTYSYNVHATRMGGGKSVGTQSSVAKQKATPPVQNVAPAKPQAAPAPAPATPPAAPAARPWGAMLGGLATGLGLAWLASSLGFGEAFGNIMMALLIGLVVLAAVGWFLKSRTKEQPEPVYEIKQ